MAFARTSVDRNRQLDFVISDDLVLRGGHLGLKTMLRYVTDPNHVDSWTAYAFIIGIMRGKALNGNVKHIAFDLTCDVAGDLSLFFKIHLIDLIQGYLFPFEFFRHVNWLLR